MVVVIFMNILETSTSIKLANNFKVLCFWYIAISETRLFLKLELFYNVLSFFIIFKLYLTIILHIILYGVLCGMQEQRYINI